VTYGRRPDCFKITYANRPKPAIKKSRFQIARYAIDSAVLPLLQETMPVAEQARRGLRLHTETFFGKDADGRPLTGHRHAYYLPTDEDGDGLLDHLTIVSETPFTDQEIRSLDRLQLRRRPGQEPPSAPIQLMLLGLASFDDLDYQPLPLRASTRWISSTPYLATRHPKRRGQKRDAQELLLSPASFLEADLHEEVERLTSRRGNQSQRSVAAIEAVRPLMERDAFRIRPRDWRHDAGGRTLRPLQFKRFRQKRSDDGARRLAGAFEIRFKAPVRGPICLGHSSHFGLGLFLPAAEGSE
jgi:CRISPR-associated protein Csb2